MFIKVLDVNDNAPEFAMFYETFVCENAKAEQVCNLCCIIKTYAVHQASTLCSRAGTLHCNELPVSLTEIKL